MYLVGADHPNKERSRQLLEIAIAARERLVTDTEAFEEILHRYVAIGCREAIEPACNALRRVVDEVYPVELEDIERARDLVLTSRLGARDALHVAVMQRRSIVEILTFDTAFDTVPGIRRRT
ncbi:MAG: type II toxin-antitoxin system VapC family toxin [Chloroflexi bacterium]|nr:type II toxin-antitoxin system VapC family toxin [Chloroflexota bacterium]